MGIINSPESFQQKMNDPFQGLDFIHDYIDNLLVMMKFDWKYNLEKL